LCRIKSAELEVDKMVLTNEERQQKYSERYAQTQKDIKDYEA